MRNDLSMLAVYLTHTVCSSLLYSLTSTMRNDVLENAPASSTMQLRCLCICPKSKKTVGMYTLGLEEQYRY